MNENIMKNTTMIKEISFGDEVEDKIIIDFEGAPFWKYYAIQIFLFVRFGKFMVDFVETE